MAPHQFVTRRFREAAVASAEIVVSFLNGVQTPTVESADADFDQLGFQFRGYHDFGVDLAEYVAGIKSKVLPRPRCSSTRAPWSR